MLHALHLLLHQRQYTLAFALVTLLFALLAFKWASIFLAPILIIQAAFIMYIGVDVEEDEEHEALLERKTMQDLNW